MTELLLAVLIAGSATYYNPGLMEQVYTNRLAWGQVEPCAECVGMVALLDAEHLGRRVWLQRPGGEPEGPFLVIDCAQQGHREMLIRRGWAVDVDHATAQRWDMRGPLPVRVLRAQDGAEAVRADVSRAGMPRLPSEPQGEKPPGLHIGKW